MTLEPRLSRFQTQDPLPDPVEPVQQVFRSVTVEGGAFRDWFGPHDVHLYRFQL
jgi:hypothetical protein